MITHTRQHNSTNKQRGNWFVYLFLSIFIIAGSGCLFYAPVKLIKTIMFIRSAETAVGTVVDLHASRGSKSTTYAPVVTFNDSDGRLIRFRSQISSSFTDYSTGEQLQVYYDPHHPERAEIKAFTPLWMPVIILTSIGLAFTAMGGGTMYALRRGVREQQQKENDLQQGMKDWETDPSWRSGTIASSTRREMWFYWLFAVTWNAIAQPTGFMVVHEVIDKGNRPALIGLMFPLVGFWLLSVAIRKTLQMRRFGEIKLQMNPSPGSLGGEVGGTIDLPVSFIAGQLYSVSLSCRKSANQNNNTDEELLWQDAGHAVATPIPAGTRIAFRFAAPAHLPPSGTASGSSYNWTIRITADVPGLDLDRSFVIPVVETVPAQRSTLSVPLAPELEPPSLIPARSVTIEHCRDHVLFSYPPVRNLKRGIVTGFMGCWFLFFTYMFVVKAGGMGMVILPVFGLIGVALMLSAFWMFGYALNVDAGSAEITVSRSFFGFPVKKAVIPVAALKNVEAVRFGVFGSGDTAKILFNVVAGLADGTRITVGDGIEGRALADAITGIFTQKYAPGSYDAAAVARGTGSLPPDLICKETVAGDTVQNTGEMTCPKCGVVQPASDVCNTCQIIISKYLARQSITADSQGHRNLPQATHQSGFPFGRLLLFGIALIVCWFFWQTRFSASNNGGRMASGVYHNKKFNFTLAVPDDWKVLTVKEAIQCSTLRNDYADQYLFIASPTTPTECLLVANIAGISLDYFRSAGWDGYIAEIGSRNPVKFSDIKNINGLRVYRVGYEVAGFYREDAYFEADKKLIEVYFYVPIDKNSSERIPSIRNLIETNLRKP